MPRVLTDADAVVDLILQDAGRTLVVGLPLGLGKANHVVNALYARTAADKNLALTLFSALTLEKPQPASEIERRFIGPVIARLFGGYPDLTYAADLRAGKLPANVEVNEFFFLAGRWMRVAPAQQNYISANYTHAADDLLARGLNVITQLVAKRVVDGETRYSLSCNTDTTLDLLRARREGRASFLLIGQVNDELPFMPGDGDLAADEFHAILDSEATQFPLFAPPAEPVSLTRYATALHVASLVRDGGSLQIGIGQIGDALAQSLILRHRDNASFRSLLQALSPHAEPLSPADGGLFARGLYGVSEMLVEAFLALIDAGIVTRAVDGVVLHGGFFLGPRSLYQRLREMPADRLDRIRMMPISFTNELFGDEHGKRAARIDARFVNTTMMATLMGAAISDGLDNGQVVSGVGGQYNFVAQAFALRGARSILTLDATRRDGGKTVSNILWSYGHQTIPRHLRDIIVTEYGIADLRGKSDADVIAAMLCVADSRFQDGLMQTAKKAGKLPMDYQIPQAHRQNTPERIIATLKEARASDALPAFPFGTDFTASEQRLIPALSLLREASASPLTLMALFWQGLWRKPSVDDVACLARMGFDRPAGIKQRAMTALVSGALGRM